MMMIMMMIEKEKKDILTNFDDKFISSQKDIDPEILDVVNKNYWDLIGDENDE